MRVLSDEAQRRGSWIGSSALISGFVLAALKMVGDSWLESFLPEPLTFMRSNIAIGSLLVIGAILILTEVRSLRHQRPWITRERLWRNWKGPLLAATLLFVLLAIGTLGWRVAEVKLFSVQGMTEKGGQPSFLNRLFGHQRPQVLASVDNLLDHDGTTAFKFYGLSVEGKRIFNRLRLLDLKNERSQKELDIYLQTVDSVNYLTVDIYPHSGQQTSQSVDISSWKNREWHSIAVTWSQPPQQDICIYLEGNLMGEMKLQDYANNIPDHTRINIY